MLEFDTLKNQLEDWCLEQQETIERLPPLEVTDEQLLEQQKECQDLLAAVDTRSDSVQKLEKMASQFFRDTEVSDLVRSFGLLDLYVDLYVCREMYIEM